MKIVIDIPEETYNFIKENSSGSTAHEAIKNGMPLPKGHGDLIEQEEAIEVATKALEQQKVGTWKPHGKQLDGICVLWSCSVCGTIIYSEHEQDRTTFHKYCGSCGARMEGDEE